MRNRHVLGTFAVSAMVMAGLATSATADEGATISAPETVVAGAGFDVTGTGCFPDVEGMPASVVVTYDGLAQETSPDDNGSWQASFTAGAGAQQVTAACIGYRGSFEYPALTVTGISIDEGIGDITRDGCVVSIAVSLAEGGDFTVEVWDDGDVIETLPFTMDAPGSTTVTWLIRKPALPAAAGVGFVLGTADGDQIDYVDPWEYPADVVKSCAEDAMTLTLPGYDGSVQAGDELDIEASGFLPGEDVTVTMYSTPVVLATLIADSAGEVVGTVVIPPTSAPGEHLIELRGETSTLTISTPITVVGSAIGTYPTPTTPAVPVPAPAPAPSTPILAATGTGAVSLVPWALGLLVLGGAGMVLARRRRAH